eukprot:scaffold7518_cov150-Amphora_coffeaeformis.AAC.4
MPARVIVARAVPVCVALPVGVRALPSRKRPTTSPRRVPRPTAGCIKWRKNVASIRVACPAVLPRLAVIAFAATAVPCCTNRACTSSRCCKAAVVVLLSNRKPWCASKVKHNKNNIERANKKQGIKKSRAIKKVKQTCVYS